MTDIIRVTLGQKTHIQTNLIDLELNRTLKR